MFSLFMNKTRNFLYNTFNQSIINFKSEVSINAKLKSILDSKIPIGKILLTSNNIVFEKKTLKKRFFENIDCLKLSINIMKNVFKSKWMMQKNKHLSNNTDIIGYLNIMDVCDEKNIQGNFNLSYFPVSFLNFFTTSFKKTYGTFDGNIKIFGTLYQPKVSADLNFQNIFFYWPNLEFH